MTPARAIDDVVHLGLAAALKQAGFSTSARTFRRRRDGAIQVVNVQPSQGNGRVARSTINLGVYRAATLRRRRGVRAKPRIGLDGVMASDLIRCG